MRMTMTKANALIRDGFPAATLEDYPDDSKVMLPVEVKETLRVKGGLRLNVLIGKKPNPFARKGKKKKEQTPRLMRTLRINPNDLTR